MRRRRRASTGAPLRADDPDDRARLVAGVHRPYAGALAELVEDRLRATGRCVILDLHSYPRAPLPYELHAQARRPELCLGTDPDHTPPDLVAAARTAFAGWDVVLDEPFRGTYVPLRHLGREHGVRSLMLELRRDTHLTDDGRLEEGGAGRVAGALARLVAAVGD